jgi:hypothetical protein
MARAALRWRVNTLADNTGVGWARLQQMEKADGVPSAREEIIEKVRQVFEDAGVIFLDADDTSGVGVRLKVD